MTDVGHNRWPELALIGEVSLYLADFCLTGSLIISQYNQKKAAIISGKQWLESFCIFIRQQAVLNCEKIISQLGKNIFPVGAIWFCSWDLVFRQLLHEYTAWICVVSLRQVSESQNVRLCLLKTSCFPSPVRPHTRCPRSRVYNIMRVGQESLLFLTLTVK